MMKRLIFSGVSLIVLGLHHGCGQPNEFQAPPPPPVTVTTPEQRDVTMYAEFTGRLEARENVEIRARVQGFLETVDFEEGEVVEEGALLFTIEPERYEAERDQALAEVEKAKAELELAEITLQRSETALEKGGISEIELLDAKAKRDVAAALLNAAEVAVGETELELSYTKITAPIEGRTSRKLVSEGNLVGGGEATLLTTLVDDDPIHAYFTINERDLLIFLKDRDRPSPDTPREQRREVTLRLTDGSEYPETGRVDFADNRIDPRTGSLQVRAVFPNEDGVLYPGLFCRVKIPIETQRAILVPEVAVQRDLASSFLLVVDGTGTVQRRDVELGLLEGRQRVITSGLEADERVIVAGLQRAREGVKVDPKEAGAEGAESPADGGPEEGDGGAGEPAGDDEAPGTDEQGGG
jgi:RND family efflux transporter MFP subunit